MATIATFADQKREPVRANGDAAQHALDLQPDAVGNQSDEHAAMEKRVEEAVALWLATDKFSWSACDKTAKENLDDVLDHASSIERDEARRLLHLRDKEAEYRRIVKCSASKSRLNRETIIKILAGADAWPYQVLQAAKRIEKGESAR